MAAHHHHHLLHNPPTPCCSCTSSFGHGCSFKPVPHCDCHQPPLELGDPLLLYSQNRCFHRPNPRRLHRQEPQQRETSSLILSLVSRIEALEASLGDRRYRYRSLQDDAARVIQTHFRAFLVSRSRTLGELKVLAVIKSACSSLASSISGATGFDFYSASRKAADLLVRLDSIQGADPMVRDGKRSISRDLVRFLESIEDRAKKHELALRSRKIARFGQARAPAANRKRGDLSGDQRELIAKLTERVERIRGYTRVSRNDDEDVVLEGFQHVSDDDEEQDEKVDRVVVIREKCNSDRNEVLANKKRVSFAENRNMLKLFSDTEEIHDGSDCLDGDSTTSSDEQSSEVEEIKVLSLGTEGNGNEEEHVINGASSRRLESDLRRDGDEYLLSAPLPVYMEEKVELPKRRNTAKILR